VFFTSTTYDQAFGFNDVKTTQHMFPYPVPSFATAFPGVVIAVAVGNADDFKTFILVL
jgi:hypothetical protein